MKTLFVVVLSIGIFACRPERRYNSPASAPIVNLHVVKNKNSVLGTLYEKAYGIGRESEWLFPVASYDYTYWSNSQVDSAFKLPLNMNADSTAFCLIRKDNVRDTILLRYRRRMDVFKYEMALMFDSLRVHFKSQSLSQDSLVYLDEYYGKQLVMFKK